MNKRNYQKELDKIIADLDGSVPTLFLHSCCAPCSSYVLEYLAEYFEITEEYEKRVEELQRLMENLPVKNPLHFVNGRYDPREFYQAVKGLEGIPEGGERCFACYELRMRESAKLAAVGKFDYFTTTLSISPLKNAEKINEIGKRLEEAYGVRHLPSDFKKKNGYKRSVELSAQYGLYRQDYCGCVFSKRERS